MHAALDLLLFLTDLQKLPFRRFSSSIMLEIARNRSAYSSVFTALLASSQQNIELLAEFFYGTFDIAKAHALPWDRCKLLLHGICVCATSAS